jgi:hypothetical protein
MANLIKLFWFDCIYYWFFVLIMLFFSRKSKKHFKAHTKEQQRNTTALNAKLLSVAYKWTMWNMFGRTFKEKIDSTIVIHFYIFENYLTSIMYWFLCLFIRWTNVLCTSTIHKLCWLVNIFMLHVDSKNA